LEKYIIKYSYFMGILALGLALVTRALDVVAPTMNVIHTRGEGIGYKAFMDGAFLFFVTTIASTCYAWFKSRGLRALAGEDKWKRSVGNPDAVVREFTNTSSARELGISLQDGDM
jgi:hypothetical protein